MKAGLLILPFLALFVGAIGTLLGKTIAVAPYMTWVGWGLATLIVGTWVYLDLENFKHLFSRKGAKYGASSSLVILLGLLLIVGVAVITSRPRFDKSFDVTKDKLNTLSDQSVKVIDSIKKKNADIKVIGFFVDQNEKQKFQDLMAMYQSRGATFSVEYVDPNRDPTRALAEKLTAANTAVFRFGSQENRITTFSEEKITNGLTKVLKDKSKKIYFLKGHGEGQLKGTEATGFDVVVTELENNKYETAELSLLETAKIPEDADLLVLAGPQYDIKPEEAKLLDAFLGEGGAFFVMLDAMVQAPQLSQLLEKYGVGFQNDLLIIRPGDPRAALIGQNNAIVTDFDGFSPVTKDFSKQRQLALVMPNTRSLKEVTENAQKMKVSLVAKTSNQLIVRIKDVKNRNDLGKVSKERVETGTFPVMAVANGKVGGGATPPSADGEQKEESKPGEKETRLVVVGSAGFANNQGAQAPEHRDMFANITNYLLQDEDLISIRPKDPTKSTLNIATGGATTVLNFISYLYPFLFLIGGIVYWLRRRQA